MADRKYGALPAGTPDDGALAPGESDQLQVPTFTPGPWCSKNSPTLDDRGQLVTRKFFVQQANGGMYVAEMVGGFSPCYGTPEANARLIAAAPDLLLAVHMLLEILREYRTGEGEQSPHERLKFVEAVVAKIRGQAVRS